MKAVVPRIVIDAATHHFEIVSAGRETVLISIEGKDAKARARALRARIRAARPDEVAQIRPQFVSFDLPRRLWTR